MGALENTAAKILDECKAKIQANMALHYRTSGGERWINASGRSSDAFKVISGDGFVRLVYSGDDVAPLFTIERGTTGIPPVSVIKDWITDKGLDLNPWAVRTNIKKRGGTERHFEPQDWVVAPAVSEAVEKINEEIPAAAVSYVRKLLFSR